MAEATKVQSEAKSEAAPGRKRTGRAGAFALAAWMLCMLGLGAIMLGRHELALPAPESADPELRASMASLRAREGRELAIHVLYTDCRCSQKIAVHLMQSERPAGVDEVVLLVGHDDALTARLRARGFRVVAATDVDLATRYHVRSAPLLVVLSAADEVRYVGGYTRTKQASDVRDLDILARAPAEVVSPLPVVGCAVDKKLRAQLDPTGVL